MSQVEGRSRERPKIYCTKPADVGNSSGPQGALRTSLQGQRLRHRRAMQEVKWIGRPGTEHKAQTPQERPVTQQAGQQREGMTMGEGGL